MARRTAAVLSLAVCASCQTFLSFDAGPVDAGPTGIPDGSTPLTDIGSTSSTDVANDGPEQDPCPAKEGTTKMVLVAGASGGAFCIDGTEVSRAQYNQFVTATGGNAPAVAAPSPLCDGHGSIRPSARTECVAFNADQSTPSYPMACVEWCDAWHYCHWAGKRLCGGIDGMKLNADTLPGEANSEWNAACVGGKNRFFYGPNYDPSKCRTLHAVGKDASCMGAITGLFDMLGNVSEWLDACDGTGKCQIWGGDFGDMASPDAPTFSCVAAGGAYDIHAAVPELGFRCCADPRR